MTRTYPGMIDRSIEYFTKDGEAFKIKDGHVILFHQDSHPELEQILWSEPDLEPTLSKMCAGNYDQMLLKLADCRFGGLNFEPDFTNGIATHDHLECHLRGSCIGENIVCKPIEINGQPVSENEISILRECATNHKNLAIADHLNIPLGTLNVSKTRIYEKFGFVTKQQSTATLFEKGLL